MSTEQKNAKAVGLVIPYKIGGSAQSNAQPVLLIPEDQPGPAGADQYTAPLRSEERDGVPEWYLIGKQEIAGVTFKVYGTHGGKQVNSSQKLIDATLGDKLARADVNEAKALAQQALAQSTDKLIRELVARNPALANVSKSDLLAMILRG
jgi:hypothetical protein